MLRSSVSLSNQARTWSVGAAGATTGCAFDDSGLLGCAFASVSSWAWPPSSSMRLGAVPPAWRSWPWRWWPCGSTPWWSRPSSRWPSWRAVDFLAADVAGPSWPAPCGPAVGGAGGGLLRGARLAGTHGRNSCVGGRGSRLRSGYPMIPALHCPQPPPILKLAKAIRITFRTVGSGTRTSVTVNRTALVPMRQLGGEVSMICGPRYECATSFSTCSSSRAIADRIVGTHGSDIGQTDVGDRSLRIGAARRAVGQFRHQMPARGRAPLHQLTIASVRRRTIVIGLHLGARSSSATGSPDPP